MLLPKAHIQKLRVAAHGGPLYSELKKLDIDPASILDFSVSVNPFGPPQGLRQALCEADLASYPDSDSNLLKNRLAERLAVRSENLVIGSGSTELIRLATAAYLGPGDKVLLPEPTYGEYQLAAQLVGAQVVSFKLAAKNDFRLDPSEFEEAIREQKPAAVFLCNPNNPTGDYLDKAALIQIIESAPDSLVVLDEAYVSFVEHRWDSTQLIKYPNLIVIRSLTKDYALAGVRLGYAFASADLIATLEKIKPPWNVSSLAQQAGLFVLDKSGYIDSMRADLVESGSYLRAQLEQLGLRPLPSQANFFMLKVGDAAGLRGDLLKKGILVRDCASFGLPQYVRLAYRSKSECAILVAALHDLGVKNYDR